MNANEISPKAGVRLNRIKTISRTLKIMMLLYFCLFGFFLPFIGKVPPDGYWKAFGGTYMSFAEIPLIAKLLALAGIGIFLAGIITGYQLLNLYEKGIIFSDRNVRLLRRVGFLSVGYGVLIVVGSASLAAWHYWIGAATGNLLKFLMLNFFALMSSPWVIGGLFVIVIAHIMDEGRKIQEEQELTV